MRAKSGGWGVSWPAFCPERSGRGGKGRWAMPEMPGVR